MVALVLLAGVLVGALSFYNGQRAVNAVASRLRSELAARILRHLYAHLETAHRVTLANASAIGQGTLDPEDGPGLQSAFLQQVRAIDSITSIYFGNTAGGLADAGREGVGGALYVIATDGLRSGTFRKYSVDPRGRPAALLATVPDFDARARPWYRAAIARGDATWSAVYPLVTGQDLAIAASRPVYGRNGELIGVLSADLFLSQISDFLRGLRIGESGQAFVMERTGLLIASSTDDPLTAAPRPGKPLQRVAVRDSASPLVRAAAMALVDRFGDSLDARGATQITLDIKGRHHFLNVDRITNSGLDWLVVVVIPEADYMVGIEEGNRATLALVLLTLVAAAAAGIVHARAFSARIAALERSAEKLALGQWEQPVDEGSRAREIQGLTRSFNTMATRLRGLVQSLSAENARSRQAEQRYRLLAENATDVIWTMDADLRLTYVSPSVMALRGYTPDEAMAEPLDRILTPASVAIAAAAIREELLGGGLAEIPPGRARTLELEYLRKDGSTVWTEVRVSVLRDSDGRPAGIIGVTRDITERRLAAQRLIRAERLHAVGQLAAGVAHEFNNTLTTMMGHAELIAMTAEDAASARDSLQAIIEAGKKAARLVAQIQDFGLRSHRSPTRVDLASTATDVVEGLRRILPRGVRLALQVGEGDHTVNADPTQIRQLITNLVHNACDAMTAVGEIRLSLSRDGADGAAICDACHTPIKGDWIVLSVADDGAGMPPEVRARIFEPFYTTKDVGEGAGLGLSQVLGIVLQHSGHIAVESAVGEGTRVAIHLAPAG
jgi:PAS domain S-box-containing protein